jgi:hypothetical protein
MLEVPEFSLGVGFEDPLLEMRYFVESVHVQLSHKRAEVLVFEPPAKDLSSKALMVKHCAAMMLRR